MPFIVFPFSTQATTRRMSCRDEALATGCGHHHAHGEEWCVSLSLLILEKAHHHPQRQHHLYHHLHNLSSYPSPVFSDDSDHDPEDPDGQSLYGVIDTEKLRCLNESITGSCVNPIKPYCKVLTNTTSDKGLLKGGRWWWCL